MKKQFFFPMLIMVLMASVLLTHCSKGGNTMNNSGSTNPSVAIQNMSFSVASLTVTTGTNITWTNKDNITHTVTADDASFDSGNIAPGSSYSRTFSTKGVFPYHCKIHPMMTATVIVK